MGLLAPVQVDFISLQPIPENGSKLPHWCCLDRLPLACEQSEWSCCWGRCSWGSWRRSAPRPPWTVPWCGTCELAHSATAQYTHMYPSSVFVSLHILPQYKARTRTHHPYLWSLHILPQYKARTRTHHPYLWSLHILPQYKARTRTHHQYLWSLHILPQRNTHPCSHTWHTPVMINSMNQGKTWHTPQSS